MTVRGRSCEYLVSMIAVRPGRLAASLGVGVAAAAGRSRASTLLLLPLGADLGRSEGAERERVEGGRVVARVAETGAHAGHGLGHGEHLLSHITVGKVCRVGGGSHRFDANFDHLHVAARLFDGGVDSLEMVLGGVDASFNNGETVLDGANDLVTDDDGLAQGADVGLRLLLAVQVSTADSASTVEFSLADGKAAWSEP